MMNEPQWLEDVVSDYECLKDVLGDKKPAGWMQHHEQLLAHVRELREALDDMLKCEQYDCDKCDDVDKCLGTRTSRVLPELKAMELLNRQEPPEISEEG